MGPNVARHVTVIAGPSSQLRVIPEAAEPVKAGCGRCDSFSGHSRRGCAVFAVGVQVQRPQHSENERPGGRRGWRILIRAGVEGAVRGVKLSVSVFVYAERARRAGFGCQLFPSPRGWRHEVVRSSRPGLGRRLRTGLLAGLVAV
jgi:hypothetical protein